MAAAASAAELAAPATPVAGAPAGEEAAAGLANTPERPKRQRAPKIDIDAAIAGYQTEVKRAAKLMADARRNARNERRKKQRLMKKASSLSHEDLERIATLKRVGLWDPAVVAPRDPGEVEAAAVAVPPPAPLPAPEIPSTVVRSELEDAAAPAASRESVDGDASSAEE
jgi:hypothetical protein